MSNRRRAGQAVADGLPPDTPLTIRGRAPLPIADALDAEAPAVEWVQVDWRSVAQALGLGPRGGAFLEAKSSGLHAVEIAQRLQVSLTTVEHLERKLRLATRRQHGLQRPDFERVIRGGNSLSLAYREQLAPGREYWSLSDLGPGFASILRQEKTKNISFSIRSEEAPSKPAWFFHSIRERELMNYEAAVKAASENLRRIRGEREANLIKITEAEMRLTLAREQDDPVDAILVGKQPRTVSAAVVEAEQAFESARHLDGVYARAIQRAIEQLDEAETALATHSEQLQRDKLAPEIADWWKAARALTKANAAVRAKLAKIGPCDLTAAFFPAHNLAAMDYNAQRERQAYMDMLNGGFTALNHEGSYDRDREKVVA